MARILWNDSFLINYRDIDSQHKRLVDMINDLDDAMRQGKGKEALAKILTGLVVYTRTHFETEEKYLTELDYPGLREQKREHAGFVMKISDFKNDFQSGQLGLSIKVMDFLSNWITHHIKHLDKQYAAWIHEKEMAAC